MLGNRKQLIELERKVAILEERDREKSKIIEEMQYDLDQQRKFLFMLKDRIEQIEQIEKEGPIYMDTE